VFAGVTFARFSIEIVNSGDNHQERKRRSQIAESGAIEGPDSSKIGAGIHANPARNRETFIGSCDG